MTFTDNTEGMETLMKEKPNFNKYRVTADAANSDCHRCDQFDRETQRCRFSFCLFDDPNKR